MRWIGVYYAQGDEASRLLPDEVSSNHRTCVPAGRSWQQLRHVMNATDVFPMHSDLRILILFQRNEKHVYIFASNAMYS